MRVVTVSAEKIHSLSGSNEISCSLSVNPRFPIPIEVAMAFATEPVAFGKVDEFSIIKTEFIPVFCIMAIEAPPHTFCMTHFNVGMFLFECSLFSIHFHRGMAIAARIHPFGKGRGRNGKLLAGSGSKRDENNSRNKTDE